MRAFISWSGKESAQVALAIRDWLPSVLPGVRGWMSSEDIREGTRWSSELAKELDRANIGLICVTRENASSEWLLYEAGAIGKHLESSRVIPILVGVGPEALPGPLRQFQAIKWGASGPRQLAEAINAILGAERIRESELMQRLEQHPLAVPRVPKRSVARQPRASAPRNAATRLPRKLDATSLEILRLAGAAPEERFTDTIEVDDLADELNLPNKKAAYLANRLAVGGLLKRNGDGSFEITDDGMAELIRAGLL